MIIGSFAQCTAGAVAGMVGVSRISVPGFLRGCVVAKRGVEGVAGGGRGSPPSCGCGAVAGAILAVWFVQFGGTFAISIGNVLDESFHLH